jgi:hypothetical protein
MLSITFLSTFTKNTFPYYAFLPIPIYGHGGNVSALVTAITFVIGSLALMTATQSEPASQVIPV